MTRNFCLHLLCTPPILILAGCATALPTMPEQPTLHSPACYESDYYRTYDRASTSVPPGGLEFDVYYDCGYDVDAGGLRNAVDDQIELVTLYKNGEMYADLRSDPSYKTALEFTRKKVADDVERYMSSGPIRVVVIAPVSANSVGDGVITGDSLFLGADFDPSGDSSQSYVWINRWGVPHSLLVLLRQADFNRWAEGVRGSLPNYQGPAFSSNSALEKEFENAGTRVPENGMMDRVTVLIPVDRLMLLWKEAASRSCDLPRCNHGAYVEALDAARAKITSLYTLLDGLKLVTQTKEDMDAADSLIRKGINAKLASSPPTTMAEALEVTPIEQIEYDYRSRHPLPSINADSELFVDPGSVTDGAERQAEDDYESARLFLYDAKKIAGLPVGELLAPP